MFRNSLAGLAIPVQKPRLRARAKAYKRSFRVVPPTECLQ